MVNSYEELPSFFRFAIRAQLHNFRDTTLPDSRLEVPVTSRLLLLTSSRVASGSQTAPTSFK